MCVDPIVTFKNEVLDMLGVNAGVTHVCMHAYIMYVGEQVGQFKQQGIFAGEESFLDVQHEVRPSPD